MLIPLKVNKLLLLQGRKRMSKPKPNGNVTVRPKPIQGTGTANG